MGCIPIMLELSDKRNVFAGRVCLYQYNGVLEIMRRREHIYRKAKCQKHGTECDSITISMEVLKKANEELSRYKDSERFVHLALKEGEDLYEYTSTMNKIMESPVVLDDSKKPEIALPLHEWEPIGRIK